MFLKINCMCEHSFVTLTVSLPYTLKQANAIVDKDGLEGLFFRGLNIKLISNAISAILFSVLWKYFMDMWNKSSEKAAATPKKGTKKDT